MGGTSRERRQMVAVTPSDDSTIPDSLPRVELFQADGTPFSVSTEVMPLQSDPSAFTSSAAAGSNPTKAEFDALRTDALALRTAFIALLTKLKNAGYMASS